MTIQRWASGPTAITRPSTCSTGGKTFVGADACAYNRAAMLTAGTAATQVCFQQGTSVGGLLPADLDGAYRAAGRFSELHDVFRHQ